MWGSRCYIEQMNRVRGGNTPRVHPVMQWKQEQHQVPALSTVQESTLNCNYVLADCISPWCCIILAHRINSPFLTCSVLLHYITFVLIPTVYPLETEQLPKHFLLTYPTAITSDSSLPKSLLASHSDQFISQLSAHSAFLCFLPKYSQHPTQETLKL